MKTNNMQMDFIVRTIENGWNVLEDAGSMGSPGRRGREWIANTPEEIAEIIGKHSLPKERDRDIN